MVEVTQRREPTPLDLQFYLATTSWKYYLLGLVLRFYVKNNSGSRHDKLPPLDFFLQ